MDQIKRVSIVIPTWQRADECIETIRHIEEQSYLNIEIIVVCDGQDPYLRTRLNNEFMIQYITYLKFIELGRNWSGLLPESFGIAPLLVGYLMATGTYIMPWCDDERALTNQHINNLVYTLNTNSDIDFAYPKVKIWRNGLEDGPETDIIGAYPPVLGQITHYMFRATNLVKYGMPDWGTHPVDIALVEKWMRHGAKGMLLNEVTFSHRLDQ